MTPIRFARHRFPPDVIRHAVWLYLRFTLSYRDVEEFLAERGLDVSYETIRRWVLKFGLQFTRNLRASPTTAERPMAFRRKCAAKAPAVMWAPSCTEDEGRPLEADRQG